MSNKNKTIALASLIAAGAGVAATATNRQRQRKSPKNSRQRVEHHTAIQSVENTRKTAKVFIIPTVTTRHLHIRKNRKVSMRKAHTS